MNCIFYLFVLLSRHLVDTSSSLEKVKPENSFFRKSPARGYHRAYPHPTGKRAVVAVLPVLLLILVLLYFISSFPIWPSVVPMPGVWPTCRHCLRGPVGTNNIVTRGPTSRRQWKNSRAVATTKRRPSRRWLSRGEKKKKKKYDWQCCFVDHVSDRRRKQKK